MSYNKKGIQETKDRADERRGAYFLHRLSTLFTGNAAYLGNVKDPVVMEGDASDLHAIKAMDVQIGKMLGRVKNHGRIDNFDFEAEVQGHMDDLRDVFRRVSFRYVETPKDQRKAVDTSPLGALLSAMDKFTRENSPPEPLPQVRRLEYTHKYRAKDGSVQEQTIASSMV